MFLVHCFFSVVGSFKQIQFDLLFTLYVQVSKSEFNNFILWTRCFLVPNLCTDFALLLLVMLLFSVGWSVLSSLLRLLASCCEFWLYLFALLWFNVPGVAMVCLCCSRLSIVCLILFPCERAMQRVFFQHVWLDNKLFLRVAEFSFIFRGRCQNCWRWTALRVHPAVTRLTVYSRL